MTAESTILGVLLGRGYQEQPWTRGESALLQQALCFGEEVRPLPYRQVTRQYPVGTTIYGGVAIADFVITGAPSWPQGLVIESKWQCAQGSVDEKLPFLILSIQRGYRLPAIIVADGGGHRSEALAWLRNQVDGKQLCGVFSLVEFLTWANRTL